MRHGIETLMAVTCVFRVIKNSVIESPRDIIPASDPTLLALIDDLFAPDFVHVLFPGGREGFKQVMATFFSAVPDTQVTVEDVLADGGKVVTRGRLSGTHQGEHLEATYIDIWRLANGKVVENWIESAILGMLQQCGVGAAR